MVAQGVLGHPVKGGRDLLEIARQPRILLVSAAREPKRRAARHDRLGMLGDDDLVGVEPQALGEHAHEGAVERERAALEHHGRIDIQALGETADRLLDQGVERRQGDVLLGDALVEQRLDVGLCEDAASARDLVDRGAAGGEGLELLGGDAQHRGDLIDERARAARARPVHAHVVHARRAVVGVGLEEDHLGVLATELDDGARLRIQGLHGVGAGDDLLDEGGAARLGDGGRARSRDRQQKPPARHLACDRAQRRCGARGLMGVMALVARVERFMRGRLDDDRFDRGRSDIQAEQQGLGLAGVLVRRADRGLGHTDETFNNLLRIDGTEKCYPIALEMKGGPAKLLRYSTISWGNRRTPVLRPAEGGRHLPSGTGAFGRCIRA